MDIVSIMVLYRTFGELLTALAPSSSSRHPGGIWGCQNSKNSGVSGNFLANLLGAHRYTNLDTDWVYAGVIVHDIEKIEELGRFKNL